LTGQARVAALSRALLRRRRGSGSAKSVQQFRSPATHGRISKPTDRAREHEPLASVSRSSFRPSRPPVCLQTAHQIHHAAGLQQTLREMNLHG
jgi:hypothetical protein